MGVWEPAPEGLLLILTISGSACFRSTTLIVADEQCVSQAYCIAPGCSDARVKADRQGIMQYCTPFGIGDFQSLGIQVQLTSTQCATLPTAANKNDRNDVKEIVEVTSYPAMRFVAVKSIEQQDTQADHSQQQCAAAGYG